MIATPMRVPRNTLDARTGHEDSAGIRPTPTTGTMPASAQSQEGVGVVRWTNDVHNSDMTANEVVSAFQRGDFEDVHSAMSGDFAAKFTTAELSKAWNAMLSSFGAFKSATEDITLHDWALVFDGGDGHLQVACRGSEIVGMVLRPGKPTGRFGE
jgi:hypothetical protein